MVIDSPRARLGIITTGKSYLDVRQALDALGIDDAQASAIGLRVYKIGMTWPLDAEGVRHFAEGLEEILVVEEKRQVIEYQLKEQLYNWREDVRPRVVGKYDEKGEWEGPGGDWLLPAAGELTPAGIARVIAGRMARFHTSERITAELEFLESKERALAQPGTGMARVPHYCSGCPHNTSTKVPDGSRALAGIGCHYMAVWLDPEKTQTFSQMGGEGVAWVGQAPFTDTPHVFANLGDGTFAHSGLLAIRQAVSAKASITYKILFNDAVAMTGGQMVDGTLTVPQVARQVAAEGVERIVVVTDAPEKYASGLKVDVPGGVKILHRRELDTVQRSLREYRGVSVLIYDQTCAAEKRRRRKRGTYPDPAKRIVINDRVCEGCGDCSAKSNCMSVVPIETEFGRKREIDQSSCNKDYSCVEGFCPSFVAVLGGNLRRGRALDPVGGLGASGGLAGGGGLVPPNAGQTAALQDDEAAWALPEPVVASADRPYGILVTGVGGTGIVTIGALLGTAATLEGKGCTVLDMAGLAQKGGPVWSHVRIAASQDRLHAARIAAGEADLVLGCDMVVSVADDSLAKMRAGATRAVVNSDFSVTSDFVRTFAAQAESGDVAHVSDPQFPVAAMQRQLQDAVGEGRLDCIGATRIATALMGDSIATNLFMVGYACQKGLLPVSAAAILRAVEINGAAVAMNQSAFLWGRRAALEFAAVEALAAPASSLPESRRISAGLDEMVARRVADLTEYQSARYAQRYASWVSRAAAAETQVMPGHTEFTEAVARYLYKLMAIKDEYEVAQLTLNTDFLSRLHAMFEGDFKLQFNLAPPLLSRHDPATGLPRKQTYGPWILKLFAALVKLRRLRGTPLDLFGYTQERRRDRRVLDEYQRMLGALAADLRPDNHALAIELACLPEGIRGYGHVRKRHIEHTQARRDELMAQLHDQPGARRPESTAVADSRSRIVMAG